MRRAAIDIGTNSTRLLVADEGDELLRRTVVTGLGRGIGRTGRLSPEGSERTLAVLANYRRDMDRLGVTAGRAVMTAVGRNASDAKGFQEMAKGTLGFEPQVISGEEEARLSYAGAVADLGDGHWTVVDIGGGSTELVTVGTAVSYPIGSVALTELYLGERPVPEADLVRARDHARSVLDITPAPGGVVGVAGTWTSLSAMNQELDPYRPELVHHSRVTPAHVEGWVGRLSAMSVEETSRLPGLDPARAPVILGGCLVAATVLAGLGVESCLVSEHDLLDGLLADTGDG